MTIGELFINIGIKGGQRTLGALNSVKQAMGSLGTTSAATLAGISAAVYGFERLTSASGRIGTSLLNFTALTGESAQQLQKWQYAAMLAGSSGEEMASTFKTIQSSMTDMLLGKGAPEGLGLLASRVGFDIRQARDTQYVLGQLQKFAQSVAPDIGNAVLRSFGLSDVIIAGMRRGAFNPNTFSSAPKYTDVQIKSLNQAQIAWEKFGLKIEMAIGNFNAKHGVQLVNGLDIIISKTIKLTDAIANMGEKFHVFQVFGKYIENLSKFIELVTKGTNTINRSKELNNISNKTNDTFLSEIVRIAVGIGSLSMLLLGKRTIGMSGISGLLQGAFDYIGAGTNKRDEGDLLWNKMKASIISNPDIFAPKVGASNPINSSSNNTHVQQTLNFNHDGKDHQKTADSVKKAAQHFVRQSPAQGWAS